MEWKKVRRWEGEVKLNDKYGKKKGRKKQKNGKGERDKTENR